MSPLKIIAAGALAGLISTPAALAADAVTYPAAAVPEAAPVYDNPGFDWNRFYAGVYGSVQNTPGAWEYGIGINAGINTQIDFMLLGGEVAISGLGNSTTSRTYGQALARAGLVVTDDLVLYGAGGYGVDLSAAPDEHWLLGAGVELALTENVSMKGQYLHGFAATPASAQTDQISIGLNYHF